MIQLLLFGEESADADIKTKNVKHTEILVDLRESILQVARHFMARDPKLNKVNLVPDYSMESHALDHEQYVNVSRTRRRRAKALLGKYREGKQKLLFLIAVPFFAIIVWLSTYLIISRKTQSKGNYPIT